MRVTRAREAGRRSEVPRVGSRAHTPRLRAQRAGAEPQARRRAKRNGEGASAARARVLDLGGIIVGMQDGDRQNRDEAEQRAAELRADPKVRAWLRRAKKLFAELPPGTWVYWQEDDCCLMAQTPEGGRYMRGKRGEGSDPAGVVGSFQVPGSDAGGW